MLKTHLGEAKNAELQTMKWMPCNGAERMKMRPEPICPKKLRVGTIHGQARRHARVEQKALGVSVEGEKDGRAETIQGDGSVADSHGC